jgi:hypothetical protein
MFSHYWQSRTDGQDDLDSVRDMPGIHVILEVGVRSATLSAMGNRLVCLPLTTI